MVFKYISIILKIFFGSLFLYSSLVKLMDIQVFAQSLGAYEILPRDMIPFFSYYIPFLELFLLIALLIPKREKELVVLMMFVIFVFQLSLLSLILRGIEIDCGCFGDFTVSPKMALIRNFGLLFLLALLLFSFAKNDKLQNCN